MTICNFIIIFVLLFSLSGCNNEKNIQNDSINNANSPDYVASRTAVFNESSSTDNLNNNINPPQETDIASFSTKIYTPDDTARQTNISLTCSKLNGTVVKSRRNIFFLQYCWKSYS